MISMKYLFFSAFLCFMIYGATSFAQTQSITYDGIAINVGGQRLANQTISLRLSILDEGISGAAVYIETQSTTTTTTGVFTIQVGQGNAVAGAFASIDWMASHYFLKVEMDPAGGANYGVASISQILANATATAIWQCGNSISINHLAGAVAPVNKTVTYGTVTNIPGTTTKCWITSNLGADHQATSADDATEASAGWYWQFNRIQGYKNDGSTVTPALTITRIVENSDWLISNDPCTAELGSGWRLPTSTEWSNVNASGNWGNSTGSWNSDLKMHAAGYLNGFNHGLLFDRGVSGYYWSRSQGNVGNGFYLNFFSYNVAIYLNSKANALSVRCIRD